MDTFNVLSKTLGGKIIQQDLSYWNIGVSYRRILVKDYSGYKLEINDYGDVYEITIKAESDFACAINIPDKLFGWTDPFSVSQFQYKVYFRNTNPFEQARAKDFWDDFGSKINELNFADREGIFFHGHPQLVLTPERDIIQLTHDVIKLIDKYDTLFWKKTTEKVYAKDIPENLRPLIPLLKKWAIADDSEREQLKEQASDRQKKNLVKKVMPYLPEINSLLDSFGDEAKNHEAILLGNLAELVSELQEHK